MLWQKQKPAPELPSIILKTPRTFMRPPRMDDWPAWARVRQANKDHIQPFEPTWGDNALERDFFERRLRRQLTTWKTGQAQSFLIFEAQKQTLIGGMNINNIARGAAQYAALGYWVDKAYEGQGYMAEVMEETLRYCFEDLDLHRVNCSCLPHNERSQKLLLNAGFQEEGFAKNYIQINGTWADHKLYGLPIEYWSVQREDKL